MIALGCATTDERAFRAGAAPAIEAVAEEDSLLMRRHGWASIDAPCNEMLTEAASCTDLEAIVLVHESVRIEEGGLLARIRALLATAAEVAVIGSAPLSGPREVEAVGGDLIVLSAWGCAELRFDPLLSDSLDASAADLCCVARARGRRVVADSLGAESGRVPRPPAARRRELRAGANLRRKWELPAGALEPVR